ncbi:hypothetical protein ACFQV2_37080 [Actinokineospora soli]|uniref:Essential protein Yae1 N-terminal domain-containing protein n=1 Tax=Actinokineospora soli TaxID=1048753 RepID=A0ABW2TY65_9PSEU
MILVWSLAVIVLIVVAAGAGTLIDSPSTINPACTSAECARRGTTQRFSDVPQQNYRTGASEEDLYEQAYEEGYEQGFEDGYSEGRDEGYNQGRKEAEDGWQLLPRLDHHSRAAWVVRRALDRLGRGLPRASAGVSEAGARPLAR